MIYFARVMLGTFTTHFDNTFDSYFIKIGCSNNPHVRVATLEREYGKRVRLIAVTHGGRSEEQDMHRRFGSIRLPRKRGQPPMEWFFPTSDLLQFIASLPEIPIDEWDGKGGNDWSTKRKSFSEAS